MFVECNVNVRLKEDYTPKALSSNSDLTPIQNGFGIKVGSEAIVHAARSFSLTQHDTAMAIVKFDFRNAFNELFRKLLLSEVKEIAPSLYPMLRQAYSCSSQSLLRRSDF